MQMTKQNFKAFREDFKSAVADLEKKYGVTMKIGSISYSDNAFSTKLSVVNGTSATDAERNEFEQNVYAVSIYGLTVKDYGREFASPRGTFTLVGVKPRAQKNPLIIRSKDGKQYVCAPSFLGLKIGGPIAVPAGA